MNKKELEYILATGTKEEMLKAVIKLLTFTNLKEDERKTYLDIYNVLKKSGF